MSDISNTRLMLIVFGSVIGLFLLIGLTVGGSYVSAYNYGNTMEVQLKTVQEQNKNVLAQYGQKVQEAAQVPAAYVEDLTKVTTAAIGGRYGADGSKAVFQMLKEQNPSLDPKLYQQLQQIIEAGRDDFQNGQKHQIDIKRQYETALGSFWKGTFLKFAGYPKEDLKDFDIVSTDRADTAFKNHKEDGIVKIR